MGGWSSSAGDAITGVPVVVGEGGTGATSLTDGGVLLGSGTGAVTAMGVLANGEILVGDGTTDPVALAAFSSSTGDLTLAAGGTAASLTAVNGAVVYCGASAMALTGAGSSGQLLSSAGAASPVWTTATYPATTTINQILYSSAANTVAGITTAASGVLITSAGGVPSIATDIPTAVTIGAAYVYRVGGTDVSLADGGTGASLSDPNADRILFWDDDAGAVTWLAPGNSIAITTTTLDTTQDLRTSATPTFAAINLGNTNLSDYVEGTFTPTVTLVGGAGNTTPVYTTNTGRYTRIGNQTFVDVLLSGDGGNEGAGTGEVNVALPITASASHPANRFMAGRAENGASDFTLLGQIDGSGTTIQVKRLATATSMGSLTGDDQNNTSRSIRLKFFYEV